MISKKSIIVTIRSSDERTEQACIQSILDEGVTRDQIHVVKEAPFKKALENCFKVASESGKKWLLTLDADMILLPGTLEKFYQEAVKMPQHFIQIQAKILDKFYGKIRKGGPRFYRVQHVCKALTLSHSIRDHIRPESNILNKMGEIGYPSRYISPVIALHDFEQYYADVYRKACVHAVKHMSIIPIILEEAVAYKDYDNDYRVILKGIYDSLSIGMDAKIDKRIYIKQAKEALSELELKEKTDVPETIEVSRILNSYSVYIDSRSFRDGITKDVPSTRVDSVKSTLARKGLIKSCAIYSGVLFTTIGNCFLRFGKK